MWTGSQRGTHRGAPGDIHGIAAQHAALSDPTARQEINGAAFGSIDKLLADGTIDEKRAWAMSVDGRRETADTVYWRDHYRKSRELPFNPRPNEDRRSEDQYVVNQLRRLGMAAP